MRRIHSALLSLLLAGIAPLAPAQAHRPTRSAQPNSTAATGAYREPAATMRGVLHKLSGKEIVLITQGDESVSLARTRKTKFFRGGKEIKPVEIALGSVVSIDVGKFADLTPQALNVMVDSPPIDGATSSPAPPSKSETIDEERPASESSDPATAPAEPKPAPAQAH